MTSPPGLREQLRPIIDDLGPTEAARRAGMRREHVSAWASGTRLMSIDLQLRLARALGLRVQVYIKPERGRRVLALDLAPS